MRQTQLPASQVIFVTNMQGIDDKSAEQMMFMDWFIDLRLLEKLG
jgi:hypothetical protein